MADIVYVLAKSFYTWRIRHPESPYHFGLFESDPTFTNMQCVLHV